MKLFISYHLADTKSVIKIKKTLDDFGIKYYSVPINADFSGWHNEEISKYLLSKMSDCQILLCIVGEKTFTRPHVDYELHEALKGGPGKRLGIITVLLENRNDTIHNIDYKTFPNRLSDNKHYIVLIQNASLRAKIDDCISEAKKNQSNSNIIISNKRKCMNLPNKYYV